MSNDTLKRKVREVQLLQRAHKRASSVAEFVEDRFKTKKAEVIDYMEANGIETVGASGAKFTPYSRQRAYVDDPKAFIEWAKVAAPELVQVVERKQLLTNEVRRRIDDGEPLPPGVKFVSKPDLSITKG